MQNIYFLIDDLQMIKQLMDHEMKHNTFHTVGISTTILDDCEELVKKQCNVLVLQYSIDEQKSLHILETIVHHPILKNLELILIFNDVNSKIFSLLSQYHLEHFLIQPYNIMELLDAISAKSLQNNLKQQGNWNIETATTLILKDLGIPMHLLGFRYFRSAIMILMQQYDQESMKMNQVYINVARIHSTTSQRVEKCMRTALQYAYHHQPERICVYNTKPTISMIVHYVCEQLILNHVGMGDLHV